MRLKYPVILFFFSILFLTTQESFSQTAANKKYQGLLWEISGNGMKKPSYLFGTMHVSSKMVFHLADSFYYALQNVNAVAIELNPEVWQTEMVKLDKLQKNLKNFIQGTANDYLTEKSFRIGNYEDELKTALQSEPNIVNGLLYRSYKAREDFEEDTFLDLYIYQTAKRLGKITTGVEDYFTTEKIVLDAYADMANEKKKPYEAGAESPFEIEKKVEDAYRRGDLDLLDSLQIILLGSEAFRNKFLLKRNEIQANSIDTILKKNSLFVGVGAAHLPGDKGVIELLRKMGYKLRPVKLLYKNAIRQNEIDRQKVPVNFIHQAPADSLFSLDVPGRLYQLSSDQSGLNRSQYADMGNGAYYLVTRVQTYNAFNGSSEQSVYDKVDSLLYENIPGKIISKNIIKRNGYSGIDITNKTRRGDLQRYQVFITPYEVVVFKMSGKETYVQGTEAQKYFSSIQLKPAVNGWVNFEPAHGGFKIQLPEIPHQVLNTATTDGTDRWEYQATDKISGNSYLILKKTIDNFNFLDEDTFDLKLVNESFKSSDFIKQQFKISNPDAEQPPSFYASQSLKDGSFSQAKIVLQGSNYYLLAAKGKDSTTDFPRFFSSFKITPFKYEKPTLVTDTFMRFTVMTSEMPDIEENFRALIETISNAGNFNSAEKETYWPKEKVATFKSDKTGELITVQMQKFPAYFQMKDSVNFIRDEIDDYLGDDDMVLSTMDSSKIDGTTLAYHFTISDTNTSRLIKRALIYADSRLYKLATITDSSGIQSDFVQTFFSTFRPIKDSVKFNMYSSKTDELFNDIKSTDSATHARAMIAFPNIYFSKDDIPKLGALIKTIKYGDKDYFDIKVNAIRELGYIKSKGSEEPVTKLLKEIYESTADTSTFENAVIRALARNKTKASYGLLKELLMKDPPLLENNYDYYSFFSDLSDSLPLAKTLFPAMLHLLTIDDYKEKVTSLLATLVDSNLLAAKDYKPFYTNIYFDAKIALKKQQSRDENLMKKEIKSKEDDDNEESIYDSYGYDTGETINNFAKLLMPFFEKEISVRKFFDKLLHSKDPEVQLSTATLLLRNNKNVADSILTSLAINDKYRASLYESLKTINREQRFPSLYKTQQLIARSLLAGNKEFNKIDSLEWICAEPASYRNQKGIVHFYKYRVKKDDSWKIAFSGLQPTDTNEVDTNKYYTRFSDKRLDSDTPVSEQFKKEFEKMIILSHKSGKNFYVNDFYNNFGLND